MPKDFSPQNLYRDLGYALFGINCTQRLFEFCPPKPNLKVLEAGCGVAKLSLNYALTGCYCLAFDIDPDCVKYGKRLRMAIEALLNKQSIEDGLRLGIVTSELNIQIIQSDIFGFQCGDNHFDLCFSEGVPQHWPDEERRQGCINFMARVAKKVAIIGNNGLNPKEQEIDRAFQFKYLGMPPTRKCFTPDELVERMTMAGLVNVHVVPVDYVTKMEDATLIMGYGEK